MSKPFPIDIALAAGGAFFACAKGELIERLHTGDPVATALLIASLPARLPAPVLRAFRDSEIRRIASQLRSSMPGITNHRVAGILAAAGGQLDTASAPAELRYEKVFGGMDPQELRRLAAEVKRIINLSPATTRDTRWPRSRQLFTIVCN
jgi:hypothetical protein